MTIDIAIGSRVYKWPEPALAQLEVMRAVLAEEEERLLGLAALFPHAPEHLLVHQVRMYLFRFAIPAIEIEAGALDCLDEHRVRQRLWLCLLGRALDDIVDGDSPFFSPGESAILLAAYARLLDGSQSESLYRAMAASFRGDGKSTGISPSLSFEGICDDVCRRVDYYLAPTASAFPGRLGQLRRFLGVTLGGCDLDDVLADHGRAATLLSETLRQDLADEEGKIRLGVDLLSWYVRRAGLLVEAGKSLERELRQEGVEYGASVVADEHGRLARQLAATHLE